MKIFIIRIIFLMSFIGCKSFKVKEIPFYDATQPFLGKIEKIEMINYRIGISNLKSDILKESGIMIFDKNNNVIKQYETSGK